MIADVIVRSVAQADVREAAFWYESKREGLGGEFILELDALYERITRNPRQFPVIEDATRRALLRRFPYAVYFVIGEDAPVIIAVLHQHRTPDAWHERR